MESNSAPVMDKPKAAPTTPPFMDVKAAPVQAPSALPESASDKAPSPQPAAQKAPDTKPKTQQAPKDPKKGVALAIVATVVIVLSLAALAVFAYLKQNQRI